MAKFYFKFACTALFIGVSFFNPAFSFCERDSLQQKDTLYLTLLQADKLFIDSNFLLLAAHYNVDASKALIEQAKLWNNPILNTDQVINAGGKFFPYGKNPDGTYSGQYYIQIQQLISTAGKRSKLVKITSTNAKLAELQLQDAMRSLRLQLHTDYYTLQQQYNINQLYNGLSEHLNALLQGMKAQLAAGNIAQRDFLRIQSLVVALQQDITENKLAMEDASADLRILLRLKSDTQIIPADSMNQAPIETPALENCIAAAFTNNPDYLAQQQQVIFQQQNLSYQQALGTPDITISPEFDRNGQFAQNFFGLGISLPLPVFNKNQGNIKSAALSIKEAEAANSNSNIALQNNVAAAYKKLLLTQQQDNATQKDFYTTYKTLFNNMLQSYKQKQVSLVDFVDFYNAFTETELRRFQQQMNLQTAKEELNYQTGIIIIP